MDKLTKSLHDLDVDIANKKLVNTVKKKIQEESEEEKDEDEDTIKKYPIKTQITVTQSVLLTKLATSKTNALLNSSTKDENFKIKIRFKSIGSIEQISPSVFKISKTSKFYSIKKFIELKLKLKLNKSSKIYCYLGNAFLPNPDDELGNLFELFKTSDDELLITYCNTVAFG